MILKFLQCFHLGKNIHQHIPLFQTIFVSNISSYIQNCEIIRVADLKLLTNYTHKINFIVYGLGGSMPHVQGLSNNPYPEPNQSPFIFAMVVPNYKQGSESMCDISEQMQFYIVMLASRQTPNLMYHSRLAVHDCLFNIFKANLYIWRPTPTS